MQNAVELALEHKGGKLGGMDAKVIFVDDQRKPDVAKQLANRLIKVIALTLLRVLFGRIC